MNGCRFEHIDRRCHLTEGCCDDGSPDWCVEGPCQHSVPDDMQSLEGQLNEAFIAIERLHADINRLRDADSWVPVRERLPEIKQMVMVNINNKTEKCVHFLYWEPDALKLWKLYGVTHWRPLPEPPKEDHPNAIKFCFHCGRAMGEGQK